jgi:hypothetical protein
VTEPAGVTRRTHVYSDIVNRQLEVTLDDETCTVRFDIGDSTALLTMPQARSLVIGITSAITAWRDHIDKATP